MTTEATPIDVTAAPAVVPAPPVVAPVAPVVVPAAVPPAAVPPAAEATVPVVYNPTGDAGLDMTLKFVGDLGYSPDHPAMAAAMRGDFALLKAELGARGVKGYEAYIELGQKAYTEVSAKTAARQATDKAAIEGIAGGPEQWALMSAWATANADEGEKVVLAAQLGKGGLEGQMAATWLAANYNRAHGKADTPGAGRLVADTRGAPAGNAVLSPREYGAAVAAARQAHKGGSFESSPAYAQLGQRRMAWQG